MRAPKALFFDVFGTCVDWRTTVISAGAAYGLPSAYADDWRGRYQPQLETVRSGARPWTILDILHREALDEVLADHGVELRGGGRLPGAGRHARAVVRRSPHRTRDRGVEGIEIVHLEG